MYKALFGLDEASSHAAIQSNFIVSSTHGTMLSKTNNKLFQIGAFTVPSLNELRINAKNSLTNNMSRPVQFSFAHEIQGDALLEHAKYPGGVFQAASQFNCLEFSNWKATPELGISGYASDPTQGPACALACAAGTVFRNNLVDVEALATGGVKSSERLGQYKDSQINNLDLLEKALYNEREAYFNILNGYTFSQGAESLERLSKVIEASKLPSPFDKLSYDEYLGLVKVGLHSDVGVTFRSRFRDIVDISEGLTVTQVYVSALSCAYSGIPTVYWASFAKLVLDAAYEATLWAAVLNAMRPPSHNGSSGEVDPIPAPSQTHKHDVFLSFIGGGVFGNDPVWISDAIGRALAIMHVHNAPINVHIAHFRRINDQYVYLIDAAYKKHLKELAI